LFIIWFVSFCGLFVVSLFFSLSVFCCRALFVVLLFLLRRLIPSTPVLPLVRQKVSWFAKNPPPVEGPLGSGGRLQGSPQFSRRRFEEPLNCGAGGL